MKDPAETVQAAHEFVEKVDWDLIEEAADVGANVVEYLRGHPWMLVAIGAAMTGLGVWQMIDQRSGTGMKQSPRDVNDLVRR